MRRAGNKINCDVGLGQQNTEREEQCSRALPLPLKCLRDYVSLSLESAFRIRNLVGRLELGQCGSR